MFGLIVFIALIVMVLDEMTRPSQLRVWERKQSLPSASSSSLRNNSLPTGPSLCGQRGSTVSSSPHPAAAHTQNLILQSLYLLREYFYCFFFKDSFNANPFAVRRYF